MITDQTRHDQVRVRSVAAPEGKRWPSVLRGKVTSPSASGDRDRTPSVGEVSILFTPRRTAHRLDSVVVVVQR